ncbi:MAG: asparagine synthase (glutamine-hydrolyzing) [Actinobacteria bacterium]|nr:asparagine synthase (glutamine-hydrolyzing) [Actinomycetota bacterium]
MCGVGGCLDLRRRRLDRGRTAVAVMNDLLAHRGPDGEGTWFHDDEHVAFAHRRLTIIDLDTGAQPMPDGAGNWITYNGEVYNYLELRNELGEGEFRTHSDTEVVLRGYRRWGIDVLTRLRGMFAFGLWDEAAEMLLLARDPFGIKPMYWAIVDDVLYFASEIKALLPFLPTVETDLDAFKDYVSFQFCLAGKTLFKGVNELQPGHYLQVRRGNVSTHRYWEVYFDPDFTRTGRYFEEQIRALVKESVALHLRADVPVGAYVSGGFDSSVIATLASETHPHELIGFTGKFGTDPAYDESAYARDVAASAGFPLEELDIGPMDFVENLEQVVYHLDHPVAGPGSFPQYMVSGLAAKQRKVLLGGQGGDEIFGGYTRYLIAYFEQCIRGAIDGTMGAGNFIVTYESIIPNLKSLKNYKPLLKEFWREGLFDELDARYYRLVNRAPDLSDEIRWSLLSDYSPYEAFRDVFHGDNVSKESYFDSMTHFDFKTLLPALLQVEDRVSMAHGLESRVPLLDRRLVELAATIPADVKFKDGSLKHVLRQSLGGVLPASVAERRDKMGFPVPLQEWVAEAGPVREFVLDLLSSDRASGRDLIDNRRVLAGMQGEHRYGRRLWGFLCLEIWQREFHDKAGEFRKLLEEKEKVLA